MGGLPVNTLRRFFDYAYERRQRNVKGKLLTSQGDDSMSFVTIALIGIAIAIGPTVLVYAFRSTDSDMNALDKPGPSTGQSQGLLHPRRTRRHRQPLNRCQKLSS